MSILILSKRNSVLIDWHIITPATLTWTPEHALACFPSKKRRDTHRGHGRSLLLYKNYRGETFGPSIFAGNSIGTSYAQGLRPWPDDSLYFRLTPRRSPHPVSSTKALTPYKEVADVFATVSRFSSAEISRTLTFLQPFKYRDWRHPIDCGGCKRPAP